MLEKIIFQNLVLGSVIAVEFGFMWLFQNLQPGPQLV